MPDQRIGMSSSNIFVRVATQIDLSVVAEHIKASLQESSIYRGQIRQVESFQTTLTYVGGAGDTVFGSVSMGSNSSLQWRITHIYVEPVAREIGIGDEMLLQCLKDLCEMKADFIESDALPGDRSMKNLFERHGLVAQTIIVGKSLSGLSTAERASQ